MPVRPDYRNGNSLWQPLRRASVPWKSQQHQGRETFRRDCHRMHRQEEVWYMMLATESRALTEHLPIQADDEMLTEEMNPQGLRRASAGVMRPSWQTT
jgi:hypothetical protein